ncbi:hypothetical protein GMORB2_0313 [Geosmithia morbida]|uniref:Uncharacterized protein n=1 Tax=Geosmithia morbida TaxID=1094350 RepID=A0A9P4Z347_9HYPO|nr:uncharacterized protein GMORB2_0313 [Geosmithia morbida]KAF4126577.1 hypothetical protein GMORB2_0313 [Geosmithia morbida]
MRGRTRDRSHHSRRSSVVTKTYRRTDDPESSTFRGRSPQRASSPRRARRSRSLSRPLSPRSPSAATTAIPVNNVNAAGTSVVAASASASASASVLSPTRHILLNNRLRRDHCPSRASSPRRRWSRRARSSTRRGDTDLLILSHQQQQRLDSSLSGLRNEIHLHPEDFTASHDDASPMPSPT